MFVDASAIVAILTAEADCARLTAALDISDGAVTSPIAVFEAAMALARKRQLQLTDARDVVEQFLAVSGITLVPVSPAEGRVAIEAATRYGKGRGHPAQLNLGDCFAYAGAQTRDRTILFTGNDFAQTDLTAV